MVLGSVTEELLARGVVVLHLQAVSGSATLAILAGLLLHIALHLYQGGSAIVKQSLVFFIVTGLMYSPFGLLSAISFHACANISYVDESRTTPVWLRHYRRSGADARLRRQGR